jgi:hypothetical protein
MANENDMKTSTAVGPNGTESPVKSPVEVPVLSFDRDAFMETSPFLWCPDDIHPSHVYVMRCERFVKVGITSNLKKRLAGLQGENPFPVILASKFLLDDRRYAYLAEQRCHKVMREYRVFGEWFDVPFEVARPVVASVVAAARTLLTRHRTEARYAEVAAQVTRLNATEPA